MKNVNDALDELSRARVKDLQKVDRLIRGARKEVTATLKAQRLLREMFEDGALDAYPTSDEAPEYFLKKWCGYKESEG